MTSVRAAGATGIRAAGGRQADGAGGLVSVRDRAHTTATPSDPCPAWDGVTSTFDLGPGVPTVNSSGQLTSVAQSLAIGGSVFYMEMTTPDQCFTPVLNGSAPVNEVTTYGSLDVNGVWLVPQSSSSQLLINVENPDNSGDGTEIEALGSNQYYNIEIPDNSQDPEAGCGETSNAPLLIVGQVNLGSDNGTPWVYAAGTFPRPTIGGFQPSSNSQALSFGPLTAVGGAVTSMAAFYQGEPLDSGQATVEVYVPLPSAFTLGPSSGGTPTAGYYFYTTDCLFYLPGGGGGGSVGGGGGGFPPPTLPQVICQSSGTFRPSYCGTGVKYMQARPHRRVTPEPSLERPRTSPLTFNVPSAYLGGLPINNMVVTYNPDAYQSEGGEWTANGTFEIGDYGIAATVNVAGDGQIIGGTAAYNGDIPIIPGILDLSELDATVYPQQPTLIGGGATVKVLEGSLLTIPGCLEAVFADANSPYYYSPSAMSHNDCNPPSHLLYGGPIRSFAIGGAGTVQLEVPVLGPISLGSGYGFYIAPNYFEFGGNFTENLVLFSVNGNVAGALDTSDRAYNMTGNLSLCLPDNIGCGTLGAIVSSKGVGACGTVSIGPFSAGAWFTYQWGASYPSFGFGCDDQSVQVSVASASAAADTPQATTIQIPAGVPVTSITVSGAKRAPLVQITGPNGQTLSNNSTSAAASGGGIVIVPFDTAKQTIIGIEQPAAGTWTITPLAGSANVTKVTYRDAIAAPRVQATVVHKGKSYLLHYRIRRRPQQSVTFVEAGQGIYHVLGTTSAVKGTLKFTPALGHETIRTIQALVTLNGLPNHDLTVTHFTAAPDPKAAAATGIKVSRSKGQLELSWKPGANTESSVVSLTLSDGRRLVFIPPKGTHHLVVPDVSDGVAAHVAVTGTSSDGSIGATAQESIARTGVPGPVTDLHTATGTHGVVVRWHAATGASLYRVHVTFGNGVQMVAVSTKPYLQPSRALKAIRRSQSARVVVRAQSAEGEFGQAAVITYRP